MDYKKLKVPHSRCPKIRMLTSCFSWEDGQEIVVEMETVGELYFNDVNDRWVYVYKNEEGTEFEYIRKYISGE